MDGKGRQSARDKHVLNLRTIQWAFKARRTGASPKKKGRKACISRDFFALVAKHLNSSSRIMEVKPVWMKYFTPVNNDEESRDGEEEDKEREGGEEEKECKE